MPHLLRLAGGACILGAAVWFLLAAREGGFLLGALLSLFSPDRDLEQMADRGLSATTGTT